ncbi:MAG TPA: RnfABCDGE type electron transport complex subunit B [Candidatus Krumholzibacteria bacterium]|nr:RnfABCDGE type electron transport complex subunit B [Candidatus Krumholzibacteria bacterium]HPD70516.1 RnfABCDGE type electron transport complex subunit B [Candidatus Krumholzibacteria bacterium]HRY39784.1 RnfABCDGE type electron transport complex subunit B [Candidatus Krumholzibacteria bacterium]
MDALLVYSLLTMGGLGVFFSAALAIADKKLRVEEDPRIGLAVEVLPGANCGACGFAGCNAYAEAVVTAGAGINRCPVGGQGAIDGLALIMGVEATTAVKHVVRLMCRGTASLAREKAHYDGPTSCAVQDLVSGGAKACQWGCLGGGDCVSVCTFGALEMGPDGLPVVYEDLCMACAACVTACPRDLFELHPVTREFFVFCKNHDDPKTAKDVCEVACTGCTICARNSEGAITMVENLAVIDHEKINPAIIPIEKCKTRAIGWLHPQPEPAAVGAAGGSAGATTED